MNFALSLITTFRAGAVGAVLAGALPARAPPDVAGPAQAASAPPASATGPAMSIAQVIEHLGARGYSDISEVERKSDKLFEVTTRDAQGVRRELLVDARSGEVLRSERDD